MRTHPVEGKGCHCGWHVDLALADRMASRQPASAFRSFSSTVGGQHSPLTLSQAHVFHPQLRLFGVSTLGEGTYKNSVSHKDSSC